MRKNSKSPKKNTPPKSSAQLEEALLSSISSIIIAVDDKDRIVQWNKAAEKMFGIRTEKILSQPFCADYISWDFDEINSAFIECRQTESTVQLFDVRYYEGDEPVNFFDITLDPYRVIGMHAVGVVLVARNVTARKLIEKQMLQEQKLQSVGQLSAGIAHEINTPVQYIKDNIRFLHDAFHDIMRVIRCYIDISLEMSKSLGTSDEVTRINNIWEKSKLDYLLSEIPDSLNHSIEGIEKIADIVRAMQVVSHPGEVNYAPVNINKSLRSILTITRNNWKYVADIKTDFENALPEVLCYSNELNQAILNLLNNAVHAVAEKAQNNGKQKGIIWLSTMWDDSWIEIRIRDSGLGIPASIQSRIFDPFFTTKRAKNGIGNGLAFAHKVIVELHGGVLSYNSEYGVGTTFIVRLPINNKRYLKSGDRQLVGTEVR